MHNIHEEQPDIDLYIDPWHSGSRLIILVPELDNYSIFHPQFNKLSFHLYVNFS